MIQIVVPMAGEGRRFAERGYTFPKPLVEIDGKPMVELVAHNVRPREPHRFSFVCHRDHLSRFALAEVIGLVAPGSNVVAVREATRGALCSALLAADHIEPASELLIINGDQLIEGGIEPFLSAAREGSWDGYIMTFPSTHPKWSFARIEDGYVTCVAEKRPISNHATVGVYYFRRGAYFLEGATRMLVKDASVGGEFFVSPVYNELILAGRRVGAMEIPRERMHSLGTPEDVERFAARAADGSASADRALKSV